MRSSNIKQAITRAQYDAVLFDLDGVITDTADLHAACWKRMFDGHDKCRAAGGETRERIGRLSCFWGVAEQPRV